MTEIQQALFHESAEEALRALVDAVGGPKAVGTEMMPSKRMDDARRLVLHWCDESRPEKPSLEELLWLLKRGRAEGCHVLASYLMTEAGYEAPTPIEPETEQARLRREYIGAVEHMDALTKRMERLMGQEAGANQKYAMR